MSSNPQSGAEGKWEAAGRQHGCYCGVWDKNPALYEQLGYPLGFCGIGERCGVPGHTKHFPGPIPNTGSWCDRCYRILAWTWPFRTVPGWIALFSLAVVVIVVGRMLRFW